jgi:hypothetical protein
MCPFREVIRRPGLIGIHLAATVVLLLLFYWWLSLPERTTGDVALSAVLALVMLFGALWLYAASLAAFDAGSSASAFRLGLQRLPHKLPWVVLIGGAFALILRWRPGRLSFLPWLGCGIVLLILLPPASQGIRGGASVLRKPRYWAVGVVTVVAGAYLAVALVSWAPDVTGIASQTISLAARFGLAALIGVVAWLTLAALISHLGRKSSL